LAKAERDLGFPLLSEEGLGVVGVARGGLSLRSLGEGGGRMVYPPGAGW